MLALSVTALNAQQADTIRRIVELPATNRPQLLRLEIGWGAVTVAAHDAPTTRVELVDLGDMGGAASGRRSSLDSLYGVERRGDTVFVTPAAGSGNGSHIVGVRITVPRRTSVQAYVARGGNLEIRGVAGTHEVRSRSGNVTLSNVSGSAIVDARSGTIKATFLAVDAGAPLSFATANGLVDITLPASIKATLRARAYGGVLTSHFDVGLTSVDASPRQQLSGPINGGGPTLLVTTLNGAIMIRRRD